MAIGTVKEQLKLLQAEKRIEEEKVTPETLLSDGKVSRIVKEGEKMCIRDRNKIYKQH